MLAQTRGELARQQQVSFVIVGVSYVLLRNFRIKAEKTQEDGMESVSGTIFIRRSSINVHRGGTEKHRLCGVRSKVTANR